MRDEKLHGPTVHIMAEWLMDLITVRHQVYGRYQLRSQKNSAKKLIRSLYHIQKKFEPVGVVMVEARSGVPVVVGVVMLTVHHAGVALNLMANDVVDVAVEDSGAPHAEEMAWGGVLLAKEVADSVIIYYWQLISKDTLNLIKSFD